MTNAVTLNQEMLDKLHALLALAPFNKDTAAMVALVQNAQTQLANGVTLEATILASFQASLDTYAAQGMAQVTALNLAKAAVDAAKDALNAQAANVGALLARKPLSLAMGTGIRGVLLSGASNQALSGVAYMLSLMPGIYDKRVANGRLLTASFSQSASASYSSGQHTVRSHAGGVNSVLKQGNAKSRGNGKLDFFLPLAKSAADPTTKSSYVYFEGATTDGSGYTYYWASNYISNEDSWGTDTNITAANGPRIAWFAYDKTNKTLVYLSYDNTANLDTNGQPQAANVVRELFANGTSRVVAGVTGWIGYLAYILGTPSRFIPLSLPAGLLANTTSWTSQYNSYSTPRLRMGGTLLNNAQYDINTSGTSGGVNAAFNAGIDGSYCWGSCCTRDTERSHNLTYTEPTANYQWDATSASKLDITRGEMKTPMWVIEADGSVNIYSIYYEPDYTPLVSSYTNNTEVYQSWNGYNFLVTDAAGVTLAQGYAPIDANVKAQGQSALQAGLGVANLFPAGFHIFDNVIQSFSAVGCKRASLADASSSFPQYGSYSQLSYQKLIAT